MQPMLQQLPKATQEALQLQPVQSSHIYDEENVAAAPIIQLEKIRTCISFEIQAEMMSAFLSVENNKIEIMVCVSAMSKLPKEFVIFAAGISLFKKRPLMPVTCRRAFYITVELLLKKKVFEARERYTALFVATKKGHTFDQLLKNYTDDVIMQDDDGRNALYVIHYYRQNKVIELLLENFFIANTANDPLEKLAKIANTENDLLVMVIIMFPYCDQ